MTGFKDNLKELRQGSAMTQKQLAERLGVLERSISYWESGSRECDFETLIKIAEFFNVTTDELLGHINKN